MTTRPHELSSSFLAAWKSGAVCLHPTDTLPGLSVNPDDTSALTRLERFKTRQAQQRFISLVSDVAKARRFWQPLPSPWEQLLNELWPGPLSVVWQASPHAPRALVAEDGSIALRCPRFHEADSWMNEVLTALDSPLPTTSVNFHGTPPCVHWQDALALIAGQAGFYSPELSHRSSRTENAGKPSSVIRLAANGSYTLLREGAIAGEMIARMLEGTSTI